MLNRPETILIDFFYKVKIFWTTNFTSFSANTSLKIRLINNNNAIIKFTSQVLLHTSLNSVMFVVELNNFIHFLSFYRRFSSVKIYIVWSSHFLFSCLYLKTETEIKTMTFCIDEKKTSYKNFFDPSCDVTINFIQKIKRKFVVFPFRFFVNLNIMNRVEPGCQIVYISWMDLY